MPGAAASSATAARSVASRSPRLEPSPTYARGTAASLATLPGALGRRLLVAVLVALCGCGSAVAATGRGATDPPEAPGGGLSGVGAGRATPPGPGGAGPVVGRRPRPA